MNENNEPLDEMYLRWLYSQVAAVRLKNPSRTYWNLFLLFYTKKFLWFIPNDDNRGADGCYLRHDFIREQNLENVDPKWMELECSFLEMLIGISRRLAFITNGETRAWFWHILKNIRLDRYDDRDELPVNKIEGIINTVMWRTYRSDGRGGLFPLKNPDKDQRNVELWYQLNSYVNEMNIV